MHTSGNLLLYRTDSFSHIELHNRHTDHSTSRSRHVTTIHSSLNQ